MGRQEGRKEKFYEEYVYILDYIPYGSVLPDGTYVRRPTAQAVGEKYFMLLELAVDEGMVLSSGEKVFVSRGREGPIRVRRRLLYDDLTAASRDALLKVLEMIVEERESEFVEVFNKAEPITTRLHELELMRGIGRKTLWRILDERRRAPFRTFREVKEKAKVPDPKRMVIDRIIEEMKGREKYYLFIKWSFKPS